MDIEKEFQEYMKRNVINFHEKDDSILIRMQRATFEEGYKVNLDTIQQLRAKVDELQKDAEPALLKFVEFGGFEEESPLERLRFFCSLAMRSNNKDWLDSEQFFDAIEKADTKIDEAIDKAKDTSNG